MEKEITERARSFGAELVGFAPVAGWENEPQDGPPDFWSAAGRSPLEIRDWAETVVVLGAPLLLPILDTCPSIWGLEQEKIVTGVLEKAADRVSALLTARGEDAVRAPLSDGELVFAGRRAGLGRAGKNRRLLTRDFGPRVKLIAVVTSFKTAAFFETDPECPPAKSPKSPCLECDDCRRICPVGALDGPEGLSRCEARDRELRESFKNPCGSCMKVCPVGLDRALYRSRDFQKYFDERKAL
jgi:epoxyqueuosine reductase QueG